MTLVYSCMAVQRAGTVILSTLLTAVSRLASPVCRTFWHATALACAPVQGHTALVATRCCSSHGFSSRHLLHDTYTKQNLLQHGRKVAVHVKAQMHLMLHAIMALPFGEVTLSQANCAVVLPGVQHAHPVHGCLGPKPPSWADALSRTSPGWTLYDAHSCSCTLQSCTMLLLCVCFVHCCFCPWLPTC